MKHDCNLLSILALIGFLKIICVGKKRQLIIFALRESNNYPVFHNKFLSAKNYYYYYFGKH
jgi:hypothetical protein